MLVHLTQVLFLNRTALVKKYVLRHNKAYLRQLFLSDQVQLKRITSCQDTLETLPFYIQKKVLKDFAMLHLQK